MQSKREWLSDNEAICQVDFAIFPLFCSMSAFDKNQSNTAALVYGRSLSCNGVNLLV